MIAVIFEVNLNPDYKNEYLEIAIKLKEELEKIEGFISVERFESLYVKDKLLSLSFWENEEAISAWKYFDEHRNAQTKGKEYIFKNYYIKVAEVIREYGMNKNVSQSKYSTNKKLG